MSRASEMNELDERRRRAIQDYRGVGHAEALSSPYQSSEDRALDTRKMRAIETYHRGEERERSNTEMVWRLVFLAAVLIGLFMLWAAAPILGLRTVHDQIFYAVLLLTFVVAVKWW
ncbi:MAG: hypothetical protein OXG49_10105 [Chloroflexi bacterium]|nr:hypothetical protein [Chloroflexota bacterium]